MPYTPEQVKFVDIFSEERFTEYLNFVNRIISGGKNVILYNTRSFKLEADGVSTNITVNPGMCIIKNVLIHVTSETVLNVLDINNYLSGDGPVTCSGTVYNVFLYYKKEFTTSPNNAYFFLVRNPTLELMSMIENGDCIWIGSFLYESDCQTGDFIRNETINIWNSPPITISNKTYYFSRENVENIYYPSVDELNGGVVYINEEGKYVWDNNW